MYKNEDIVICNEDISLGVDFIDLCLVVIILVEMVDENGRLFIVVRRGFLLNRVFFIWNREMKKNIVSIYLVVRVYFGGE